jgi:hypothetical protein
MTDAEFDRILAKLPTDCSKENDFRGSYSKWIQILKACKYMGKKDEFIKWSSQTKHNNYNEMVLFRLWETADTCVENVGYLLKNATETNRYTYKKIPDNEFVNYVEINKDKLGQIFEQSQNYLIMSDPGTGKTTSFKKYVSANNIPFISITSRVSLSFDQYESFTKEGICVQHYKSHSYEPGDSIIVTPESSLDLHNYDFSNYVIFMDEFDSIVNHVLVSDTMKTHRISIFTNLLRMLATCKQFVCADADISMISKRLLDCLDLKYTFLVNNYRNYKNVEVCVIYDEDHFFEIIQKTDAYLLCSDGKKDTDISSIRLRLGNKVYVITSDSKDIHHVLDDHEKVLMSPKIIYGVDSLMRRVIFCHYSGQTISPSQMVQQVCRCRNITKVYVFFSSISSNVPMYSTIGDTRDEYTSLQESYYGAIKTAIQPVLAPIICEDKTHPFDKVKNIFDDLYVMTKYKEDCYNTNKFLHMLDILRSRGFVVTNEYAPIKRTNIRDLKKQADAMSISAIENAPIKIAMINKFLKIPEDRIKDYIELFGNDIALAKHFNISMFFFSDNIDDMTELMRRDDFDICKCKDIKLKIALLDSMLGSIGLDKHNLHLFCPDDTAIEGTELIKNEYLKLFRVRKTNFDIKTRKDMYKEICNIYKILFGITTHKLKKIKKDVVANIHTIDLEALEYHRQIYMFRNQPKEKKIIRRKTKTDALASTKTSKVTRAIKPPKQLAPSTQL